MAASDAPFRHLLLLAASLAAVLAARPAMVSSRRG
jgi:hypothetical protein